MDMSTDPQGNYTRRGDTMTTKYAVYSYCAGAWLSNINKYCTTAKPADYCLFNTRSEAEERANKAHTIHHDVEVFAAIGDSLEMISRHDALEVKYRPLLDEIKHLYAIGGNNELVASVIAPDWFRKMNPIEIKDAARLISMSGFSELITAIRTYYPQYN